MCNLNVVIINKKRLDNNNKRHEHQTKNIVCQ